MLSDVDFYQRISLNSEFSGIYVLSTEHCFYDYLTWSKPDSIFAVLVSIELRSKAHRVPDLVLCRRETMYTKLAFSSHSIFVYSPVWARTGPREEERPFSWPCSCCAGSRGTAPTLPASRLLWRMGQHSTWVACKLKFLLGWHISSRLNVGRMHSTFKFLRGWQVLVSTWRYVSSSLYKGGM